MDFYNLQKNTKTIIGLDISKRVVHKAGEFLGNKIADTVTESKDVNAEIEKPV